MQAIYILYKYRIGFWAVLILDVIFVVYSVRNNAFFGMLFVIWLGISFLLQIYIKANEELLRILDIRTYSNSVSTYNSALLRLYKAQKRSDCKYYISLYLASGYLYMGDMHSLNILLEEYASYKKDIYYYYLRFCHAIELGDLKIAKSSLDMFNSNLPQYENKDDYSELLKKQIMCTIMFKFHENKEFRELAYLECAYKMEQNPLIKCRIGYYFGMCLLRDKQNLYAKRILNEIIKLCPESMYSKKAINILDGLIVKDEDCEMEVSNALSE